MRKQQRCSLGALLGAIILGLVWAVPAHSQRPPALGTFPQEIVRQTEVEPEDVAKVLTALGPVISQQLAAGRQVALPGLGSFRVVRIPEHRELVNGRPATVPAVNYVEFLPDASMVRAANTFGATPAVVVPPFQYIPIPDRTPSTRVPSARMPSSRVR
jgi:nucleoid DNA-binding protein